LRLGGSSLRFSEIAETPAVASCKSAVMPQPRWPSMAALLFMSATIGARSQPADAGDILRLALNATGGPGLTSELPQVTFRDSAEGATHDQSPTASPPFATTRVEDLIVVDPYGDRVYRRERGPNYEQTFQIDGHDGWVSNPPRPVMRLAAGPAIDGHRRVTRRLPAFLLLEAAGRAETASSKGTGTFDGRPHDIVEVTLADGLILRLWIDARTRLLSRYERPYLDASLGDTVEDTVFAGYRAVGSMQVPSTYTVRRGPFTIRVATLSDVEVGPVPKGIAFRPAVDAGPVAAEQTRPFHEVRRLAPRVYLLEQVAGQNFNVLFVDQDDGIVVIDAPETRPYRGLNERVMAAIRRTLPGRPIRYVVPTHHHTDHGAGLRPYIAEGIPVITTPGNVSFVRQLAAASFRSRPDGLTRRARPPVIEVVHDRRHTIRSGSHVIELHDIGPEYHAQENLAVWLPEERILFLTDIFETAYRASATWDGGGELGRILSGRPWPIDQFVTSHSSPRRMADLRPGTGGRH
jgi:glyoxylase-like metal-dependent hydrolase (beta-lactamase superfamily II)